MLYNGQQVLASVSTLGLKKLVATCFTLRVRRVQ